MADKERYRKYAEAVSLLGKVTRARAEEIVREMVAEGDGQRAHMQRWMDDVVDRGRKATEELVEAVRAEVSSQLESLGLDPEDLGRQAADILRRSAEVGMRVMREKSGRKTGQPGGATTAVEPGEEPAVPAEAAKAATGKEAGTAATAKKSPAKKATAKKATAKKAAAKKSPAKKATAKKATAKKAAGSTAKATKSAGKKSAAKKSAAGPAGGVKKAAKKSPAEPLDGTEGSSPAD